MKSIIMVILILGFCFISLQYFGMFWPNIHIDETIYYPNTNKKAKRITIYYRGGLVYYDNVYESADNWDSTWDAHSKMAKEFVNNKKYK